jgi:NADH-quinone oxidoreductase subunit K
MDTIGVQDFLVVAVLLFSVGFLGVVLRRNLLFVLMSLELMLNAVNVALVAFSRHSANMDGSLFVFFIMTVAAAEVSVGLALLVALYKKRQSVFSEHLTMLKN